MSLYETTLKTRRDLLRAACLAVPGLGLAGCGFQPLYGAKDASHEPTVSEDLEQILILPIGHRAGQQLHNLLRDRLNPKGQPAKPDYTLAVQLSEEIDELGIQLDATATRARLTMIAQFALLDLPNQNRVFQGTAKFTNSFDILEDPYATQVAEFHARERSLVAISDELRLRIAAYFRQ
ncbi:MAG: LPS assembly lipoprotein LptE, partial [Kiloniellales bacterium]|nr:LPS assembly lipoprotein LptE [Kiloniellales bacterium]